MFKTFYEYENKNINDYRISEYCKAENLNEEYFRFSMRKLKNHSIVKNMIAATLLVISNVFKH